MLKVILIGVVLVLTVDIWLPLLAVLFVWLFERV